MASLNDLTEVSKRLRNGSMALAEIRALLQHPSPLIRANALDRLAEKSKDHDHVLKDIISAAIAPINTFRLMGTITVGGVAIAALLRVATPEAVQAANGLLENLSEPQRTDLIHYLKSEGLLAY